MTNIHDTIKGAIGVGFSVLGVVTAPDDWLKVIPAALGCAVAGVTIWSIRSRNTRERELARLTAIREAQAICHVCRQDERPPKECPYPLNDRPTGCLLKDYNVTHGRDPHHHKHQPQKRD